MPKKSKKNIKKTTRKRGRYNLKKTFKAGNRIKGNNSSKKLRKNKHNTNGGSQEELSWEDVFEPTETEKQERKLRIRNNNAKLKKYEKEINKKYPDASREKKMEILRDMMGYKDKEEYKIKGNYVGSDVIFMPPPSKPQPQKQNSIWRFPQTISEQPREQFKQNNYYDIYNKPPEIPYQYITSQDLLNKSDDSQEFNMNLLFEDEDIHNKSPPPVQRKEITRSTRKNNTKSNEKKSNEIKPGGPKEESILESLIRERESEPVKTNIIFPPIKTNEKGFTIHSIEGSLFEEKSNKPKSNKSKSNKSKPKSKSKSN